MRQIGSPPEVDIRMSEIVKEELALIGRGFEDATTSIGGKDFLERILGLIRGTGFTIAVFSDETRLSAMANISLELGFAALCGKPIIILKSENARAPSDLTRTDWIDYNPGNENEFRRKIKLALETINSISSYEETLLDVALEGRSIDCAVAFERANKAFLLTGEVRFLDHAEQIKRRLEAVGDGHEIGDLERLRGEISIFVQQGRKVLGSARS